MLADSPVASEVSSSRFSASSSLTKGNSLLEGALTKSSRANCAHIIQSQPRRHPHKMLACAVCTIRALPMDKHCSIVITGTNTSALRNAGLRKGLRGQTCQVEPPGDIVIERMNFWLNLLPLPLPEDVMPSFPFIRSNSCSLTCRETVVTASRLSVSVG